MCTCTAPGFTIWGRRLSPSAEGARIEAPKVDGKANRKGVPPPEPTRDLEVSVVSSPAGSRAEPWPKTILVLSERHRTFFIVMFIAKLCTTNFASSALAENDAALSFYRATANAYALSCYRRLSVCPSVRLSNA